MRDTVDFYNNTHLSITLGKLTNAKWHLLQGSPKSDLLGRIEDYLKGKNYLPITYVLEIMENYGFVLDGGNLSLGELDFYKEKRIRDIHEEDDILADYGRLTFDDVDIMIL